MFWHIPNFPGLHGVVIGRFRNEYHLFTTKGEIENRVIHHSVSPDGLSWRTLPDLLGRGRKGAFDAFTLYDLQVIEHDGTYYLFYTGLDRPTGPGQHQAVGLATSRDLVRWERCSTDPVLVAAPEFYEPFVPDEATYQEKDRRRQWFRDPWVYRDPATGTFGMTVGARAAGVHPDVNGCLSWAESSDLIHWTARPPLYCPRRFHTMECPVIFEQGGRTYLIWLTHPEWGTPLAATDPWQHAGAFYAFSDEGLRGPYRVPRDEILIGGSYTIAGRPVRRMRAMVARVVVGLKERNLVSYHLNTAPAADDDAAGTPWTAFADASSVMPLLKPVRARPDGDLEVQCSPELDKFLDRQDPPEASPVDGWQKDGGAWRGKNFSAASAQTLNAALRDGLFAAQVRITRGLRAGIILRAKDAASGLQIVLDRNLGCLEFGHVGRAEPMDRRRWEPRGGWVDLRVVACGPSLEIYCDGKLMLHQVRYREIEGRLGLLVDRAEAHFQDLDLRSLKPGTPLLVG